MLNAARRGPASFARVIRIPSTASHSLNPSVYTKAASQNLEKRPINPFRNFSSATLIRQHAAARAQAIEQEVEEEVNSQRPPSDQQINQATQHGPVTRFAELLERGMVCEPVVETITKGMGLETMTQVQSMTISESLKGTDV